MRIKFILITNFLNLEETTASSNIRLCDIIDTVDNSGASRTSDTIVVSLSDTTKSSNVTLEKVVLSEICEIISSSKIISFLTMSIEIHTRDTLLGNDQIWFDG